MEQNTVPVSATMWIARCCCGVEVRLAGAFDCPDADCVHCLAGVLWRLYEVREERGWKVGEMMGNRVVWSDWNGHLVVGEPGSIHADKTGAEQEAAYRRLGNPAKVVIQRVVRRTLRRVK